MCHIDRTQDQIIIWCSLIKYTTETQLEGGATHIIRPKLVIYAVVVLMMMAYFGYLIFDRIPIEVDVHRDRGQLFIEVSESLIENVYMLKIANKGNQDLTFTISVNSTVQMELMDENTISVNAGKLVDYPIRLRANLDDLIDRNTDISIKVQATADSSIQSEIESRFIAPVL